MGHYAYVNDGIVTSVIVGPDEGTEPDGISSWEEYFTAKGKGQAVRTSYNTRGGIHYTDGEPSEDQSKAFRGNYAGIGFIYDEELDAFIPPEPSEDATLDEATFTWVVPEVEEPEED